MLLGKRPRPSMNRTISMKEFAADLDLSNDSPMPSDQNIPAKIVIDPHQQLKHLDAKQLRRPGDFPADFRRSNRNCAAPFLRSCALCHRRLNLGRDIFMYRGEIAFCSLECRQQLMNLEERMKSSLPSPKGSVPAKSEPSGSGETVAAA